MQSQGHAKIIGMSAPPISAIGWGCSALGPGAVGLFGCPVMRRGTPPGRNGPPHGAPGVKGVRRGSRCHRLSRSRRLAVRKFRMILWHPAFTKCTHWSGVLLSHGDTKCYVPVAVTLPQGGTRINSRHDVLRRKCKTAPCPNLKSGPSFTWRA